MRWREENRVLTPDLRLIAPTQIGRGLLHRTGILEQGGAPPAENPNTGLDTGSLYADVQTVHVTGDGDFDVDLNLNGETPVFCIIIATSRSSSENWAGTDASWYQSNLGICYLGADFAYGVGNYIERGSGATASDVHRFYNFIDSGLSDGATIINTNDTADSPRILFDSLAADKITLTADNLGAAENDLDVTVIAFGGTGLEIYNISDDISDQTYTHGLSGAPDLVFGLSAATANTTFTSNGFCSVEFGGADGSGQYSLSWGYSSNDADDDIFWGRRPPYFLNELNANTGALQQQLEITSIDATDIDTDEIDGTTDDLFAMVALKFPAGFAAAVAPLDFDATVEEQAVSGLGFEPHIIFGVLTRNDVAVTGTSAGSAIDGVQIFAADEGVEAAHSFGIIPLGTGNGRACRSRKASSVFGFLNPDGSEELAASIASFDSGGVTFDWSAKGALSAGVMFAFQRTRLPAA